MPPLLPDVFITPAHSGHRISVSVGQVIGLANPSAATEWQVTYAAEVLEIVTPSENVSAPGSAGWLFRAIAPGQTDLILTSRPQPCSSQTPCPPIPARFIFTIAVQQ